MMMIAVLLSFQRGGYSPSTAHNTATASIAFFFTYMLIFGGACCLVPPLVTIHH